MEDAVEASPIARFRQWSVGDDGTVSDDSDDAVAVAVVNDSDISVKVRDRRNAYSNALKVKVLDDVRTGLSITEAARIHGIKSRTAVHGWTKLEAKIRDACDNKKRSKCSVGGQGRVNLFPYCDELVQWIKQMRHDDFPLKTSHVLVFMKEEYSDFTEAYLAKNKEESLGRMMRRIIHKNGFSFRRPTKSILSTQDLEAEQRKFSSGVGVQVNATYARSCIFNADETAVLYDDTPTRIISERGAKNGVKIKGRTRSERASVLLIVSATGQKLRPVIIFKGQPGGMVEKEVKNISTEVVTAVQTNAWMDARVWREVFVEEAWGGFISGTQPGPLALYVDNLKCHVSAESQEALAAWASEVVPLPKNTTSVPQPLDVGVMGPFKQKLRAITLSYELSAVGAPNSNMSLRDRLLQLQKLSAPEKRKRLVDRVVKAWDAVSESYVKRAWEKAGL